MNDKSFNVRVPKRWVRVAMIVGVTALIVAPLTAIASHSFTDVPDSNTFHSDIEWMKDAGVTAGCNPSEGNTRYCPDDNVTRGQMAAFMNRFAGYIGAEDGTPAQADNATTADSATTAGDADTVDGLDAADVQARMWAQTFDATNTFQSTSNNVEINSVDIEAPASGFLVISGTAYFNNNSGSTTEVDLEAKLNGSAIPANTDQATTRLEADLAGHDDANLSYTVTIPITEGTHTISQEIDPGATNDWFYNGAYLTVVFYSESAGTLNTITSTGADSITPASDADGANS